MFSSISAAGNNYDITLADSLLFQVFMDRCMSFVQNGLPERWDGVYTMTSK
ncbi:MAG: hypothetical protein J5930_03115 [Treponema sp.]|nr:hypothetical protein [Treponema sp.]